MHEDADIAVNPDIVNLTHKIPACNIGEASYRLSEAAAFRPKGNFAERYRIGSEWKVVITKS